MAKVTEQSKLYNFHGWATYVDGDNGYYPYFSTTIMERIHKKKVNNIVVTGEPGEGKSYMGCDIARVIEGYDKFSIDQVVFNYSDYMSLVLGLAPGKPIVFDEPSYSMGLRSWWDALQKALVLTLESQRFKQHPLILPIVNKSLLDKTIRSHLIQFQVLVKDRGKATVYRIHASQFEDKVYHKYLCDLEFNLFDNDLCAKDTCLGCDMLWIKTDEGYLCNIFRSKYERKKAMVQDVRYEQAYDLGVKAETKSLTMEQIEAICVEAKDKFIKDSKVNVNALMLMLQEDHGIMLSPSKAYVMRARLIAHHPEITLRNQQ